MTGPWHQGIQRSEMTEEVVSQPEVRSGGTATGFSGKSTAPLRSAHTSTSGPCSICMLQKP